MLGDVLIEEVATLKLQSLQDRRRILSLQQSRQQAEAMLASHEAMLSIADRARVEAETCVLLGVPTQPDETLAWVQQSHMRTVRCIVKLPRSYVTQVPWVLLGVLSHLKIRQQKTLLTWMSSVRLKKATAPQLNLVMRYHKCITFHLRESMCPQLRKAQKAEADANDQRQTAIHHACELGRALDYYEESSTGKYSFWGQI